MSVTSGDDALTGRITGFFQPDPPGKLGVAVSGGSDSLALLVLLREWMLIDGPELYAVTVDHGLRPEAADEAAQVAALCRGMGVRHTTLNWTGWNGSGNLPDQARRARYDLMAEWAGQHGLSHVALGHTSDDQAETFLMRLAREAGVDGLSAMGPVRQHGGVSFCRPVLDVPRDALREVLRARGLGWIDDPTNDDDSYERVRARKLLSALAPLGISAPGLARVAGHMAAARGALYGQVALAARDIVRFQSGDILIERQGFAALHDEIARRLLQQALKWINATGYAPRGRATDLLIESIRGGSGMTLQGCRVTIHSDVFRIAREFNAVSQDRVATDMPWDSRWRLSGPATEGAEIAALGQDGLNACADRGDSGLPASSLIASPAVWKGQDLLAAPLTGDKNGWTAELMRNEEDFFTVVLSH